VKIVIITSTPEKANQCLSGKVRRKNIGRVEVEETVMKRNLKVWKKCGKTRIKEKGRCEGRIVHIMVER
jgi:hypothetical protein